MLETSDDAQRFLTEGHSLLGPGGKEVNSFDDLDDADDFEDSEEVIAQVSQVTNTDRL